MLLQKRANTRGVRISDMRKYIYFPGVYTDTLQKVRGLKSAVRAYNAREHFCDYAHIGDKGHRLWMISYFLAYCYKYSVLAIPWPRLALAFSPGWDVRLENLRSRLGLGLRPGRARCQCTSHSVYFYACARAKLA